MPGFGTLKRHKVGKLRHRCILQQRSITGHDDRGQPIYTWTKVKDISTNIVGLFGAEAETARQLQAEATHRIECRFDSRMTTDMRLLYGTREFYIGYIDDIEQVGRWAVLTCAENIKK